MYSKRLDTIVFDREEDYESDENLLSGTVTRRCLDFELEQELIDINTFSNSDNSHLSTKSNCEMIPTMLPTSYTTEDFALSPAKCLFNSEDSNKLKLVNEFSSHDQNESISSIIHSDDEFDRLVAKYGKEAKKFSLNENQERDNLSSNELTCPEISKEIDNHFTPIQDDSFAKSDMVLAEKNGNNDYNFKDVTVNGRVYSVRYCNSPKPDFVHLDEDEILKHLYKYGLKRLKRAQAIKMLEYLYNQTHPLIEEDDEVQSPEEDLCAEPELFTQEELPLTQEIDEVSDPVKPLIILKDDTSGAEMIQYRDELQLELQNEEYIFQTNITKKVINNNETYYMYNYDMRELV